MRWICKQAYDVELTYFDFFDMLLYENIVSEKETL